MSEVIHNAEVSVDTAYQFTVEALNAIKEHTEGLSKEELAELDLTDPELTEGDSEAPIYNSDLLDWLSKGTSHLGWVEDALNEFEWTKDSNFLSVVQFAYSMAWQSHYNRVLEAVQG